MNALETAYLQLKVDEGLRLSPYRCTAGKLTIGYGHNLDDKPITKEAAEQILIDDIQDVVTELEKMEIYHWLSEQRKAVLINMAFNLGIAGLKSFKKMFEALGNEDYGKAAEEMLDSRWAYQVKGRASRLAEMMRGHGEGL